MRTWAGGGIGRADAESATPAGTTAIPPATMAIAASTRTRRRRGVTTQTSQQAAARDFSRARPSRGVLSQSRLLDENSPIAAAQRYRAEAAVASVMTKP